VNDCHCQFLEPTFWHDDTCVVMHDKRNMRSDSAAFDQWVSAQKSLENHVLFQTSGSSGSAKWVALSKPALLASARMVNQALGIKIGTRWGLALPIHHVGGFGVLVRSFLSGGHCQIFHQKWDPVAFSHFVYKMSCESISLVPAQMVDLIASSCVAPNCVQHVVVGGGNLSDWHYTEAKALGWPVLRSYGMTEAASQIATGDISEDFLRILDGWETRVDARGVLEWRGEASFSGYVIENDGTYSLVDPKIDGWFTTQDIVELEDGGLRVLGRADSLVKVLGELVDLSVIEQRIEQQTSCPAIVLTVADERRGVSLIPVVESPEVIDLNGFRGLEALESIRTLPEFPRSSLGKIQRASIRAQLGL
jgi:O-succinylbenzoic acid--CoA ligase